jgi:hypothetical protein
MGVTESIYDYEDEIKQLLEGFPSNSASEIQQRKVFQIIYNLTFNGAKSVEKSYLNKVTKDYYAAPKSSTIDNHKRGVKKYINKHLSVNKAKIGLTQTSYFTTFTIVEESQESNILDYIEDIEIIIKENRAKKQSREPMEIRSWIDTIHIFYNYSEPSTIEKFKALLELISHHNIKLILFCKYDFKHFKDVINYEKGGKIVITEIDKYFNYMYALIKTRSMNDKYLYDYKKKEEPSTSYLIKHGSVEELNIRYSDNLKVKSDKSISNFILHHEMRIKQVLKDSETERHTVVVSKEEEKNITQEEITHYIDEFAKTNLSESRALKNARNRVLVHINRFYISSGTESSFFKSVVWMLYSIKRLDASSDKNEHELKDAFAKVLGDSSIFSALREMKKYFGRKSPFEYIKDVDMDSIMEKIHIKGDKKEAFSSKFDDLDFPAVEKKILTSFKDIANKKKNRIKLGEFLGKEIADDDMATEEMEKYFSLVSITTDF